MDPKLLLPREQYEEVHKRYGRSPYMFEIKNNRQGLFYFGANHSHDSQNHQYPILREYWDNFLKETEGREKIVLVEQGLERPRESEEAGIKYSAEKGLIVFLCHKFNIPINSPDVDDRELMARLPDISKEEVLLYWFVVLADHYHRKTNPILSFMEAVEKWCASQGERKNMWEGFDVTPGHTLKIYERIIGRPFNEKENFNAMVDPNKTGTRINEVSRAQSDLREVNIIEGIERYWNEGKSILVVYGSGHLIIQEPALRALLK